MLITNSLMQASKNSQKKLKAKKHENLHKNEESQNLHSFWAIAFKGHWFKSPSRNLKSAKNSAFFGYMDILHEKIFGFIIALFANFTCICGKTVHFQTFFKK